MTYRIPAMTLALFFAAGTALPVTAQQDSRPNEKHQQPNRANDNDRGREDRQNSKSGALKAMPEETDFRSTDGLQGRDVINHGGEDIGDVSELVIDRGSGRIEYAVIKTGDVLGMGGKEIAIPYGALRWNPAQDKFVLNATEDELKRYPEFSADRWSAMMEAKDRQDREAKREAKARAKDARDAAADHRDDFWNPATSDPYSGRMDSGNKVRIEGEVTDVDRKRTGSGQETIITVKADDGSERKISLGPSWYVGGGVFAPSRGDHVIVESYSVRGENNFYTASTVTSNGKETSYRNADQSPAWTSDGMKSGTRTYSTSQWRYLLADDLQGMKVESHGDECGKVDRVIVERRSGEIAFLSIDPNSNFLGIGDTKRLVPWSVASVSLDKTVRIDADKDMILASPETPSDVGQLSSGTKAAMVYRAYKVEQPRFERRDQVAAMPPNGQPENLGVWGSEGQLAKAMESAPTQTLTGTVKDVKTVECGKDGQKGKAITIQTKDKGEETVILGPAWYVDAQPGMEYKPGEQVSIEVCKVNLDGKSLWVTKSLEHKGHRTAMWQDGGPVWDK